MKIAFSFMGEMKDFGRCKIFNPDGSFYFANITKYTFGKTEMESQTSTLLSAEERLIADKNFLADRGFSIVEEIL